MLRNASHNRHCTIYSWRKVLWSQLETHDVSVNAGFTGVSWAHWSISAFMCFNFSNIFVALEAVQMRAMETIKHFGNWRPQWKKLAAFGGVEWDHFKDIKDDNQLLSTFIGRDKYLTSRRGNLKQKKEHKGTKDTRTRAIKRLYPPIEGILEVEIPLPTSVWYLRPAQCVQYKQTLTVVVFFSLSWRNQARRWYILP